MMPKNGESMNTEKAVTKKGGKNQVAVSQAGQSLGDWGQKEVSKQDMTIPRILMMQHTTEKVKDGEAKAGEFRDTSDDKILGTVDKPLEFIPIFTTGKWVVYDASNPKKKNYIKTVNIVKNPTSPDYNDEWKYEAEDLNREGRKVPVTRDRVLEVYLLLPSEINSGGIPYVLGFRRTSYRAAKNLETQMYVKNAAANKPPAARVMVLAGHKDTDESGNSYFVMDVKGGRETTPEELATAYKWYQMISGGKVKVSEDVETLDDVAVVAKDVPHSNEF
jgi:hypothetical protein